jgi:hypothetical protein
MKKWRSKVLTTEGTEKEEWRDLMARLSPRDVFYMPEYLMVFEQCPPSETRANFGGKACLFVYGDEDDFIVHPFFIRELKDLPFYPYVAQTQKSVYDIASPYGYAGPAAQITHHNLESALWREFLDEFHKFCIENNIISEFVRLNPFLKNNEPLSRMTEGVQENGTVVYVDLMVDEETLWKNLEKSNRNSITRARREHVEICRTNKEEDLESFYKIYNETMDRRKAKKMYYFPREFYNLLFDLLGENANLFVAKVNDRVICASLFVGEENLVHYYLSGTSQEFRSVGANNLLLYEAILWARQQGYKIFNLGGGYKTGDSLFKFKSTFSKSTAKFYTYRKIHNEPRYNELCKAWENYNRLAGRELSESDFFPAYRR